jgi:hypothetical protein
MMIYVSQLVGDDEVELAVTLDGDGGIAGANWSDFRPIPLPELDWLDLADEVRSRLRAQPEL